jgi:hypothetical protein
VKGVQKGLPAFSDVPSPGFGYPLDGVSSRNPWKPLSAPNVPGLLSSELFSNPAASKRFPLSISSRRFNRKLSQASHLRSDDFFHGISRVPYCPQMFSPSRNRCSLELLASRALPPLSRDPKSLSLSLPSRLFLPNDLTITRARDLRGFTPKRLGLLPS